MLVRCPRCSVPRDSEREKATAQSSVPACANCGYTGAPFGAGDDPGPREPLSTFAGARAKLATATQDLFRLSGTSIPVEAEISAPPPPPAPKPVEDPTSGRKPEASLMFSLEELMKANAAQSAPSRQDDEAPEQLWSMQSATPLFGTEYDQALLTTPLKREQTSMDSMTVPSRRPPVRRLLPLVLAIAGGSAALAGVGWWAFGPAESEASPSPEVAAVQPAPEPSAEVAPVAGSEPASPAPAENAAAAEAPAAAADAVPGEAALGEAVPGEAALGEAVPGESPPAAEASDPGEDAEPDVAKSKKKKSASTKRTSPRATAPSSTAAKAPFNTAAAKDALSAAASRAASCKGTSGTGKVQLTFATSGRVSSAQIVSGPFGGTAAGNCALRHFKAAKVPAFSGSPQTVAKSFKVP